MSFNVYKPGDYTGSRMNFQRWQETMGADRNSTYHKGAPAGPDVFVRPNKYEEGRGHIVVYNWTELAEVPVDLSSVGLEEGQAFEIRDAENYFGTPVYRGQYTREGILLPVTAMELPEMYGELSPFYTHTPLEMGVYVIMPINE